MSLDPAHAAARDGELHLRAVHWPPIEPGDDLVGLVAAIDDLRDGDIVVLTSKVVSKAEGRSSAAERLDAVAAETERVVARRAATTIAKTRHGLVLAAAGVDTSNTRPGEILLLPADPDRTARRIRDGVLAERGVGIGVVVSDTAGRAWRNGQTDQAIGCAGIVALVELSGHVDEYGNPLQVTAPAVADEIAAAADLVKGKSTGCPVAVVRGLQSLVLAVGEPDLGARPLIRPAADDLFGLGTREAVTAAARRDDPAALDAFPVPVPADPAPFDGLLDDWAADAAERADVDATAAPQASLDQHADPTDPGGPKHWTLSIVVAPDAPAASLVRIGRLLERADTLAAAARLQPLEHPGAVDGVGPNANYRRCWQDR